jgi:hypothetical protein
MPTHFDHQHLLEASADPATSNAFAPPPQEMLTWRNEVLEGFMLKRLDVERPVSCAVEALGPSWLDSHTRCGPKPGQGTCSWRRSRGRGQGPGANCRSSEDGACAVLSKELSSATAAVPMFAPGGRASIARTPVA